MFCPNCGNRLPENVSFCPNCGTKVAAAQQPAQVPPVQVPPVQQVQYMPVQPVSVQQPAPKKSKKGLVIGLSVGGGLMLVLVAIVVAMFVLLGGAKGPSLTYKGMTFSYGMEVKLDELERRFPDMQVSKVSFPDLEELNAHQCILDIGVTIWLREEETTGKFRVVGFRLNEVSSAEIKGVRVGDSEWKLRSKVQELGTPNTMMGIQGELYFLCMYKGARYDYYEWREMITKYKNDGRYTEVRPQMLIYSARVVDGEVVVISFGDIWL